MRNGQTDQKSTCVYQKKLGQECPSRLLGLSAPRASISVKAHRILDPTKVPYFSERIAIERYAG